VTAAEAATQVCANLSRDVERIAPPGIGGWEPAWELVADADAEFLTALLAWERAPSNEGQARVRAAYNAVLDAWREAARQFTQQASTPGGD